MFSNPMDQAMQDSMDAGDKEGIKMVNPFFEAQADDGTSDDEEEEEDEPADTTQADKLSKFLE